MPENEPVRGPSDDSPEASRRRPQYAEVNFRPNTTLRKGRKHNRHSHGRPEHSVWQFGAGIVPPAALIGATLAVLALIKPEIIKAPMIRFSLIGITVLVAVGLGTIFYGLRPDSKRLERKEVWIAMIAGFFTLLLSVLAFFVK